MKMLLKDGKSKVVTLSYDDGVKQDRRFMEICDKYGLKCTFNINSGLYGDDTWRLSKKSAVELYTNSGHEVAVHSYTHPHLEALASDQVVYEIVEDRRNIEKDFGIIVRGSAYPFGTYTKDVIDVLGKCGIVYARTVNSTEKFGMPTDWLELNPTCHHTNPKLMELAEKFVEDKRNIGARMFYLWGHTYEFDQNDNWDVFEKFAQYISGYDEIWYATNIEIYDYVAAFKRLEVSYDQKQIFNPTASTLWFDIAGKTYSAQPGEKLIMD